ncbi:UNKNOWN [Stylonychia lemnae]|uniref:Uncharacterized protein n=1 Tax=Stylonychia lemnae TaxID=5949 RepID=A0A078ANC6_STYLE|nr:UNKNOWN [Stylonychia lemnae]|eukprot:CDW82443.1 UNKNOWN [Stylonychia lemnae]
MKVRNKAVNKTSQRARVVENVQQKNQIGDNIALIEDQSDMKMRMDLVSPNIEQPQPQNNLDNLDQGLSQQIERNDRIRALPYQISSKMGFQESQSLDNLDLEEDEPSVTYSNEEDSNILPIQQLIEQQHKSIQAKPYVRDFSSQTKDQLFLANQKKFQNSITQTDAIDQLVIQQQEQQQMAIPLEIKQCNHNNLMNQSLYQTSKEEPQIYQKYKIQLQRINERPCITLEYVNRLNKKLFIIQNQQGDIFNLSLDEWHNFYQNLDQVNKLIDQCRHLQDKFGLLYKIVQQNGFPTQMAAGIFQGAIQYIYQQAYKQILVFKDVGQIYLDFQSTFNKNNQSMGIVLTLEEWILMTNELSLIDAYFRTNSIDEEPIIQKPIANIFRAEPEPQYATATTQQECQSNNIQYIQKLYFY